jgi:hypothetical protein
MTAVRGDQWETPQPIGPFCDIGAIEAVHFVYLPLTLAD